jgi:uncharacterized membrane protein YvlD (DUF360 family)
MEETKSKNGLMSWIGKLIIVSIILGISSFLTPGFSIRGLFSFFIAAIVITTLDYLVDKMMGVDVSPFGRGVRGFIISAIIIYVAQFIVPNMHVSIFGALLAALVIGILDGILAGKTF